jgi:hypothetical protein
MQQHYAIGPPLAPARREWELLPMYHLLRLFTITTGWKVRSVVPSEGQTKHLVAFQAPAGQLTIFGLDDRGADLNTPSKTRVSYTIGGLPKNKSFQLLYWNLGGRGKLKLVKEPVKADAGGVATVRAPFHSVFALTTKKLPPL